MKLREVFRYELAHRLRSRSTWLYAAILFSLGALMMSGGGSPSNPAIQANAPVQLAFLSLLLGMPGMVVSAALFGDAAVRDVQAGMDPLVFTAPLRRIDYLGGRYLAALTANALVLLAIPIGLAVPVLLNFADPLGVGPFRATALLQPYLFILLPNMVFAGAVLFAIGALARRILPVYLGTIGIFIGTMISIGPDDDTVSTALSVLGPLGFHALNEVSVYMTAAERNTRLIGFPAHLFWNRLVWLAVSVAVLGFLHRRFRFAHPDGGRRRRNAGRVAVEMEAAPARLVEIPRVAGSFGFRTSVRQTLAVARNALAEVAASRWFVVVLLGCVGLTMLWGWNVGDTVFDTSTWPVTFLVAETVLSQRVVPLVFVLITVYAGELVWKEREDGVAGITDAAPVPERAGMLGRFLALVAMLVMIQAATLVGGVLIQAFQGYDRFEPGLYLRVVFGLKLADYVLLAALAMTIHVVVNHKNLGHMVAVLAIGFTMFASVLGVRHHLLVYGTDPGWTYSDMNGFGPFIPPFVWFKLYWAAWALLLAVVAVLFQARGGESGLRHRLLEARRRFAGPVARTAGVASALIVLLGGFIFYNTNILNPYRTPDEAGAPQAEYEKRYGRFEDAPQPTITYAELRVEIHPDEAAVDLAGTFRLVNMTGAPIDSVHVYLMDPDLRARSISFDRPAEPVLSDDKLRYRIYALDGPLEPGDSVRLAFDVAFQPRGFPNSGIETDVVRNGAYFDRSWLPFIGYQPTVELQDDEARQRFGLAPRPPIPPQDDVPARRHRSGVRNEDLVEIDMIIGTAADQIAVTPGILRRSWTENGRRYFHYRTGEPTLFGGTVFSGEYDVVEDRWNDVALQIFHHPAHDYDLDRMVHAMKASLEYFTTQFGPYPARQLRIVEFPRYGGFGHAHAHTIAFAEDAFLSRVREGEIDQPFYGTAHEVAHQWWGGMVRPAPVRGHRFLSESLANYSAMMVVEKTYGPEVARRVYDFHMGLYLRGRAARSREVPVLDVTDQSYIAYRKGAIALYTLRERIGEEHVNTALRRYLETFRDAGAPYPTSLDLYAELRAVTPDSLHSLLTDLFETVTLWEVRTERAVVEPTGTGEFTVTLDVVAKKVRADSVGNETETPMDDLVEIGIYPPREDDGSGEPLYLRRHRIRSGAQAIRITVPREPARAGIDPRNELIDRKRDDNVVDVTPAGAADHAFMPSRWSAIATAEAGHASRNSMLSRTAAGAYSRATTPKPRRGNHPSAVVVSR